MEEETSNHGKKCLDLTKDKAGVETKKTTAYSFKEPTMDRKLVSILSLVCIVVLVLSIIVAFITIIIAEESLESQEESLCFCILHEVT